MHQGQALTFWGQTHQSQPELLALRQKLRHTLTVNSDQPGTIDVATFCDPTASIPSGVQAAGTFDFTGFVDVSATDYPELVKAVEAGDTRQLRIYLPGNNGYIVAPVKFSSISYDLPIDGAVGYAGSGVFSSKPVHLF